MPRINEMMPSKFLKKEDVPAPVLVTVANIVQEVVEQDTGEMKWTMQFAEDLKPMVLNTTNIQAAAEAFGSEDTDDWLGKPIVIYTDPSVMFQGKRVGGLRLRAPKNRPAAAPKPAPAPAPAPAARSHPPGSIGDMDDDIPF